MSMIFDYLIVGGGMAADAAAKGIREVDKQGRIGVISDDIDPPYTRPALSKKLWIDPEFGPDDNWLSTAEATDAHVITGTTAVKLDPASHAVVTNDGDRFVYGRLLLATGGVPKTLDLPASERSIYFRSFADYRALRRLSGDGRKVAVIGGSYIGTELAAGLAQNNTQTTLICPDDILCGSMFPAELARHVDAAYEERGVEILRNTRVNSGVVEEKGVVLQLSDGSERRYNGAVSGLGIMPNVDMAENAGLEVNNGIVVDAGLRTSIDDIYAAGDVACYPDRILGRRRIEHVNNATQMGTVAGRIMAGSTEKYEHTPYFYSNVFDMSWQAVGTLDASLETFSDWTEPFKTGVVYYLDDARVVGVLLWNVEDKLDAAREVLAENCRQDASTLKGRI